MVPNEILLEIVDKSIIALKTLYKETSNLDFQFKYVYLLFLDELVILDTDTWEYRIIDISNDIRTEVFKKLSV